MTLLDHVLELLSLVSPELNGSDVSIVFLPISTPPSKKSKLKTYTKKSTNGDSNNKVYKSIEPHDHTEVFPLALVLLFLSLRKYW